MDWGMTVLGKWLSYHLGAVIVHLFWDRSLCCTWSSLLVNLSNYMEGFTIRIALIRGSSRCGHFWLSFVECFVTLFFASDSPNEPIISDPKIVVFSQETHKVISSLRLEVESPKSTSSGKQRMEEGHGWRSSMNAPWCHAKHDVYSNENIRNPKRQNNARRIRAKVTHENY